MSTENQKQAQKKGKILMAAKGNMTERQTRSSQASQAIDERTKSCAQASSAVSADRSTPKAPLPRQAPGAGGPPGACSSASVPPPFGPPIQAGRNVHEHCSH
ncbi:hypothetical protein BO70DRAFT_363683 [Aspergillus heteromorphus CBS 117.55]|uniref:Uncharacterized protein n=1 Tax=Aspergillus heteromorphus CBS 117.55 TaxID=1448321 RepID=A0A317VS16_9EURO|nr:uncharacterized protein BO70DRAFT_363683 [Aspergillus heteromorphus CBS 117.55]PWY77126.1 hypothetical protein BO70DRAFT_363683 [Aspergillus heteromorphus CBS 117.55]